MYGIFDGHGGSGTSEFLRDNVGAFLKKELSLLGKPLSQASSSEIENVLSVVSVYAQQEWQKRPDWDDPGSTFLMAVVINGFVYAVNAGDSRILALQGDDVYQLTEDASPSNPAFKRGVEKRGGVVEVVEGVPRVDGNLAMTRAVGDLQTKGMTARAKVTRFPIGQGATLLLACDGLFETLTSKEAAKAYQEGGSPTALIKKAYLTGSGDNMSVMAVSLKPV